MIATTTRADRGTVDAWEARGADVVTFDTDETGGVSVPEVLAHLGKRDVQSVLVEGGGTLAWSFVREDAVDRVVLYVAPKLVGGLRAPGALMGEGFAPIDEAARTAHRQRGAHRRRPEGGGGCSPGSLRNGAPSSRPERSASWSGAAPSCGQ